MSIIWSCSNTGNHNNNDNHDNNGNNDNSHNSNNNNKKTSLKWNSSFGVDADPSVCNTNGSNSKILEL